MTNLTEDQRRAIVESGPVYLADGLKAGFDGWRWDNACGVHSARPGSWACSWETAADVASRPDRRFTFGDFIWKTGNAWLGYTPGPEDYQTPEDYTRAMGQRNKDRMERIAIARGEL